jgi:hypothetical protein
VPIDTAFGHHAHENAAEAVPFRCRHRRTVALGPADGKSITFDFPPDIDAPLVGRESPIFSGIGGEFVECKPDGLGRRLSQAQPGTIDGDAGIYEIREVGELGLNQALDLHSIRCARADPDWPKALGCAQKNARRNLRGSG